MVVQSQSVTIKVAKKPPTLEVGVEDSALLRYFICFYVKFIWGF